MKTVSVSDVAIPVLGGTPKRGIPSYWNGSIKWATAKDVANSKGRYLFSTAETITEEGLNNSAAKILPKGTVIITARGTVGAIAQLGENMAFNQTCYGLVPKDTNKIDQNYLYYALKASIQEMRAVSYGTVFDTITMKSFDEIQIPLPPLPEQKAIAHILGTLDDKIELNRRMNETLEEMAKAIFKSWFVDFDPVIDNALKAGNPIPDTLAEKAARRRAILEKLEKEDPNLPKFPPEVTRLFPDSFEDSPLGPVPRGWRVWKIGDLAHVTSGQRPSMVSENWSDETPIPIFGGGGVQGYTEEPLYRNSILITGRVGTLGQIFRVTYPCWPSDNTLVIIPAEDSYFHFVYQQLKRTNLENLNRGSTQPLITQKDAKNIQFVISEDQVLVTYHKYIEKVYRKIDQNNQEIKALASIRDTLLPKLISGQIRIKDAEKFLGKVL